MRTFQGTGVALATPFSADGAVDTAALGRLVEHQIAGGTDYLVALGTTGEVATLDATEQQLVIETVMAVNAGRLPVVLGAGGNNTRAVARTVAAFTQKYKPDGILSVSPYYNKPTQAGIYAHFAAIAGETDLPIILYNVPPRTSSHMTAATTLKLGRDFKNIVATKEASGNLSDIMTIIRDAPDGFMVLSGDDLLALPLMALGAAGIISVIANGTPAPFSAMVKSALSGDFEAAREQHYALQDLMKLIFVEGNPAGVKALMAHRGIMEAHVRLPLQPATPALVQQIRHAFQKLGTPEVQV
ncbi:MAG: 4-hydroxy-tetrahydrodipicolinate synthase [Bacteroidota bacterium]